VQRLRMRYRAKLQVPRTSMSRQLPGSLWYLLFLSPPDPRCYGPKELGMW
jgi:hypothetical protein